jgi:hypothetical protein
MGYEIVKEYTDDKGVLTSFDVKLEVDTWTLPVNFALSPNKANIWCNLRLLKVPDPAGVPAKVLLGLLKAGGPHWPVYFNYSEQDGQFRMSMFIANSGVDAKVLRSHLDHFIRAFRENQKYWNPSLWS